MPDHYYSSDPTSEHRPARLSFLYREQLLSFETDSGVFSRLEIDKGTGLLLDSLPPSLEGRVLDMGCGYGAIGISLGKAHPGCQLTMADVNQRATALAQKNAARNGVLATVYTGDGYSALPQGSRFDFILQNPPIRAGKQVIYQMFADSAGCLAENGQLWLVIRKQQGAASAMAYLETLYEDVEAVRKKGGYWILRCAAPRAGRKGDTHAV